MKEIWRPVSIPEFSKIYQVSNQGNVRSKKRYGSKGCLLKPRLTPKGYLIVTLYNKGYEKTFKVHRLVALAFIPNPDNLPQINHKDENKENNCVKNLEWCTALYNDTYGTRLTKITEKQCIPVSQYLGDKLIANYASIKEAGEINNYHRGLICLCCNGKRKTAYKYKWRYTNDLNRYQISHN